MKKANVEKLEKFMSDYLQRLYRRYLQLKLRLGEEDEATKIAWISYCGATNMVDNMAGEWRRRYNGEEGNQEDLDNIEKYSHWVMLPTDSRLEKLPRDWQEG